MIPLHRKDDPGLLNPLMAHEPSPQSPFPSEVQATPDGQCCPSSLLGKFRIYFSIFSKFSQENLETPPGGCGEGGLEKGGERCPKTLLQNPGSHENSAFLTS